MEFTNVLPGVKLVKQDEAGNEEELFVSQNDHVIVKTLNGREIKGIFMQIEFARCLEEDDMYMCIKTMGKMKESRLTRLMISLRVKKEIEDEFIWEIQMILYNLLVYKTNKKEMEYET